MIFDVLPEDFKSKARVSGCYVQVQEHLLFLCRHPAKIEGGRWGTPGGKGNPGESLRAAGRRELAEETGIDLEEDALTFRALFYVRLSYGDFEYAVFDASLLERPDIRLSPDEHVEYRWVTPQEALALPLMEDEDEVIRRCYGPT